MKWTKDRPTTSGSYWLFGEVHGKLGVFLVQLKSLSNMNIAMIDGQPFQLRSIVDKAWMKIEKPPPPSFDEVFGNQVF